MRDRINVKGGSSTSRKLVKELGFFEQYDLRYMPVPYRIVLKEYGSKSSICVRGEIHIQEDILNWKGVLKSNQSTEDCYNEMKGEYYTLWPFNKF